MRSKICGSISILTRFFLVFAPFDVANATAGPSDVDLVCTPINYKKAGESLPTSETVSFKIVGGKSAIIELPGSDIPITARISSSNSIQVQFSTKELTASYFNLSHKLFLIHSDGQFTKLSCKPTS